LGFSDLDQLPPGVIEKIPRLHDHEIAVGRFILPPAMA
jgi:hypothetical protein